MTNLGWKVLHKEFSTQEPKFSTLAPLLLEVIHSKTRFQDESTKQEETGMPAEYFIVVSVQAVKD